MAVLLDGCMTVHLTSLNPSFLNCKLESIMFSLSSSQSFCKPIKQSYVHHIHTLYGLIAFSYRFFSLIFSIFSVCLLIPLLIFLALHIPIFLLLRVSYQKFTHCFRGCCLWEYYISFLVLFLLITNILFLKESNQYME